MNFHYKRYKMAYSWIRANKTAESKHKEEKAACTRNHCGGLNENSPQAHV